MLARTALVTGVGFAPVGRPFGVTRRRRGQSREPSCRPRHPCALGRSRQSRATGGGHPDDGVVHFSWYFRYMEKAEHAMWREAGLSIAPPGEAGFPRVSAAIDFHAPLRFEERRRDGRHRHDDRRGGPQGPRHARHRHPGAHRGAVRGLAPYFLTAPRGGVNRKSSSRNRGSASWTSYSACMVTEKSRPLSGWRPRVVSR